MKITIITGASSGMGEQFALQLAKKFEKEQPQDRQMWLIARTEEKLKKLASGISEKNSRLLTKVFALDLSKMSDLEKFKMLVESENKSLEEKGDFLEIEYLVNNAGFGIYGPFEENPIELDLQMVDLNCRAVVAFSNHALPYLKKGSLVLNVASLASFTPLGNFCVYGATKAFVLSFSIALAAELKDKGIKVSALCPGPVSTNFANVASNGARKEVKNGVSAEKVVAHCIKKACKGKRIILYTPKWKIAARLSSIVPRFIVARFTFKNNIRPFQKWQA